MVDFAKNLEIGLNAAKAAQDNRNEIDAVFEELNKQLLSATKGKVRIERQKFHEPWSFKKNFQPITYSALVVCSTISSIKPKEIAKWDMARSGYPCEIELPGNGKWYCDNKEGLETALGRLLQDPLVGETIQKYICISDSQDRTES